jgi:hypothetical protein
MPSILGACAPRKDILQGTFNPEIFTPLLSAVLGFYAGKASGLHAMYTDAKQFFAEATYPTDGLKMVVSEVFARIAGDNSVPAIHRLETAFGGGKTHALIACAHIGHKGTKLAGVCDHIIAKDLLPKPGDLCVVGVAGDEIPVHKAEGAKLMPYTLWGEIAQQTGGEALYSKLGETAISRAAPGKDYFDTVLGGRKVLIMLDELAQYAARLSAAHPGGGEQLAAFLMGLHGYARSNPGISVVLTLASAADAFANQTEILARLLSDVLGKEVSKDDALGIGQQAVGGVTSVVARDATAVVPVQASEISRVLAKRLFAQIDAAAAADTASAYMAMYQKSAAMLPDEASRPDFGERMAAHYPFHPTLIDFLNKKLATSENFQGTRGVLRVLALTVRNLWKKKTTTPMIHACHLDLRDARTVNEIIGRTGGGGLLPVLNADVGGADTGSLEGGRSNSEACDLRNPHPEGYPMHEYAWKTVFLHSLVGRELELGSNVFGLTEQDALFAVSFPGLTPPQVAEALKEIGNSAFYLRFNQGRYYASLDPSVNIALAKIRRTLPADEVDALLDAAARKVVKADIKTFNIVTDVALPEHIPDKAGKPTLALVSLKAEKVNIEECITTAGENRARLEQNVVLILVPESVTARTNRPGQEGLFGTGGSAIQEARKQIGEIGRTVLAMRRLKSKPQDYGIRPQKMEEDDFRKRFSEREQALSTAVTESYRSLWFPSASGVIVSKEIRTAGGEGGASVLEQIRKTLLEDGELVTAEHTTQAHLGNLHKLFFAKEDVISLSQVRDNFYRLRNWPMLESLDALHQVIRAGVSRGTWYLYRMGSKESTKPDEFFSREAGELPFDLDLNRDYSLVTPEGAHKRGWVKAQGPEPAKVQEWVRTVAFEMPEQPVSKIAESVVAKFGEVPQPAIKEAVLKLVQGERLMAYKSMPMDGKKPDLIHGASAALYIPAAGDMLITPAKAAEKGWLEKGGRGISLSGKEGAAAVFPLLRRIGSLYQRGGKTAIDELDLTDLSLPKGGRLRIVISDASADSLKQLGEFFEVVAGVTRMGETAEVYLEIKNPQENCPFVDELTKNLKK